LKDNLILIISISLIIIGLGCQEKENPPIAEFEADTTNIEQGSVVQFSDLSLKRIGFTDMLD